MNYRDLIIEDRAIQELGKLFKSNGFEIRLVGGAVRDIVMKQVPKDYDFCTDANPIQMKSMDYAEGWRVISTGAAHGTMTFMSIWGSFEVTTLRLDVECDGRHAKVEFTTDWRADAARRDFTINAMSLDLEGNLYDYFKGMDAIQTGLIRFVGDPEDRIKEDALRIIRYFRFRAKFKDYSHTPDAIYKNMNLLSKVSVERVWQEVKKASENWETFSRFLFSSLPVFEQFGFLGDVDEFNNNSVSTLASYIKDFPEFAMATVMTPTDAVNFAKIFKLSLAETEKMIFFATERGCKLTYNHAQDLLEKNTDREWIKALTQFHENFGMFVELDNIQRPVFPVSGQDLIDRGHKQGREMGVSLRNIKKHWVESRYILTKEELLNGTSNQQVCG